MTDSTKEPAGPHDPTGSTFPFPTATENHSQVTTNKRPPTQRERIDALLRAEEAVCSTTLIASGMPRAAAVIHRMRRDGVVITSRPCSRPWHSHGTPQIEYTLGGES